MSKDRFDIKIEVNNINKVKRAEKNAIAKILKAWGIYIAGKWSEMISRKGVVDTGTFMKSPQSKPLEKEVIIGSALEYAPFLEVGTSKTKARPTLEPTLKENRENLKEIAEKILKNS